MLNVFPINFRDRRGGWGDSGTVELERELREYDKGRAEKTKLPERSSSLLSVARRGRGIAADEFKPARSLGLPGVVSSAA